jgi:hypothetical protein
MPEILEASFPWFKGQWQERALLSLIKDKPAGRIHCDRHIRRGGENPVEVFDKPREGI